MDIGLIFKLTDEEDLIKDICICYAFSDNRAKDQTLISKYGACVLSVLGEITDLSKDNLDIYTGSIKANNFNSVATYTTYNDFIMRKKIHDDYTMLIINHTNQATIEKLGKDNYYEIVNCADSKYLNKEFAEKATEADNAG